MWLKPRVLLGDKGKGVFKKGKELAGDFNWRTKDLARVGKGFHFTLGDGAFNKGGKAIFLVPGIKRNLTN